MAITCLEGLLTLIRQGVWSLLILSFEEIFRVSCLISIFAEFLCGEIRSLDGEEGVLIQAIMSIISIIKLEPAIYEKVFF
jgi:AP-3 complex subunit beta